MQDIIQLLPDSIANQIAAGEVVQRPASAVKEMLENSVDADATNIKVVVKEAGKGMIQVIDDGKGMSVTDARMSFERHATSKIKTFDDLLKVQTKGFRGEALASIAAVAQVELKSRRAEDELGTQIVIEASDVKKQEPAQVSQGTSICVKNLFYNVPARRNFLKSNPVEFRHISEEFHRVALAHPDISFSLMHNDLDVYQLDSGKLSKRIGQLFGKKYHEQLIACDEELAEVKVTGYVGKPEHAKKTRGEQYFFVNRRYIKNPYLNHAVSKAYEGLLKEDYFPFYVLNIEMDPMQVDVNVHPTKTEVKFSDDRILYGVIQSAVRQALASFNVTPSLDFSTDINFEHFIHNRSERFDSSKPFSTATLHRHIGDIVWEKAEHPEKSFVATAAKYEVPIYTSSPGDSAIGMNLAIPQLLGRPIMLNPMMDVLESAAIVRDAEKNGVIGIGVGSPKNFYLQTQPMLHQMLLDKSKGGHDYCLQLTTDSPQWGGLSGATFSEAKSWGKVRDAHIDNVVVYSCASITFPLIAQYALARAKPRRQRRLLSRVNAMVDTMRRVAADNPEVREEHPELFREPS